MPLSFRDQCDYGQNFKTVIADCEKNLEWRKLSSLILHFFCRELKLFGATNSWSSDLIKIDMKIYLLFNCYVYNKIPVNVLIVYTIRLPS